MKRSFVIVAVVLAVILVVGAVAAGLLIALRPDDTATTTTVVPVTAVPETDEDAVVEVIESLRPGDAEGFDPEVWADASEPDQVLPEGATLSVEPDSVIVDGDTATADVVMSVPGENETRNWVFARRLDGEWVVYGSMELDS